VRVPIRIARAKPATIAFGSDIFNVAPGGFGATNRAPTFEMSPIPERICARSNDPAWRRRIFYMIIANRVYGVPQTRLHPRASTTPAASRNSSGKLSGNCRRRFCGRPVPCSSPAAAIKMTPTTFTVSSEGGALPVWCLGRGRSNASHAKDFASGAPLASTQRSTRRLTLARSKGAGLRRKDSSLELELPELPYGWVWLVGGGRS
jgi:hypothetical protein